MFAAGCKLVAGKAATADAGATAPAIVIELPKAMTHEEVSTAFDVDVAKSGALRVNGADAASTADVTARAREAAKAVPDVRAYIHADRDAPYSRVIEVLDAVKAGGISRVAFGVAPMATVTPTPLGR